MTCLFDPPLRRGIFLYPDTKQLYDSAASVTFCKLLSINDLRRRKTEKHKLLTISNLRPFSRFYANKTNKSHKLLVYKDLRFFKNIFCKLLITSDLRILRSPRAPKSLILNDLSCYFLGLTRSVVCAILIEVSAGKVKADGSRPDSAEGFPKGMWGDDNPTVTADAATPLTEFVLDF